MFTISAVVALYILAVFLGKQERGRKPRFYVYVAVIALLQVGIVGWVMMTKEIPFF